MPSMGVFPREPYPYLRKLNNVRSTPRETPNSEVDERDMVSNLAPTVYQLWEENPAQMSEATEIKGKMKLYGIKFNKIHRKEKK